MILQTISIIDLILFREVFIHWSNLQDWSNKGRDPCRDQVLLVGHFGQVLHHFN